MSSSTSESPSILRLAEVTRDHSAQTGTKAANLGEMLRAGLNVPPGFVLTTEAFSRFLEHNGLSTASTPAEVAAAPLPGELEAALEQAAGALPGACAVRSSATSEDLADASFAGQYETVLNVEGRTALAEAVRTCWASAFSERLETYRRERGIDEPARMALLVQAMVPAESAGVAFSSNPVTGERGEAVVHAVRGLGERLVEGRARADEWVVTDGTAECRRAPEEAIDAGQARAVAELARRCEAHFGAPQDIEWAWAGGELYLLQARPVTALPDEVEWQAPPGGWVRNYRIGEWLGDPVTPLFESWLLQRLEVGIDDAHKKVMGLPGPEPPYTIVNGWYYSSMNNLPDSKEEMARLVKRHLLPRLLLRPRRTSVVFLGLGHLGIDLYVRDWRKKVLPRYRELIDRATARLGEATPRECFEMVDALTRVAGDYYALMVIISGYGWRSEVSLAKFYRQYLDDDDTLHALLRGLYKPSLSACGHAVYSLDWVHPTLGEIDAEVPADDGGEQRHRRLGDERRAAEEKVRSAFAGQTPKALKKLEKKLHWAQRFAAVREEVSEQLTLGWPVMRRGLHRVGEHLAAAGVLGEAGDVFFLTRDEIEATLDGGAESGLAAAAVERREVWERRRRLSPPLVLGKLPLIGKEKLGFAETIRGRQAEGQMRLSGEPGSPGRATGAVRVIRRREDFDRFRHGEVLVAPATTPAWTLLFPRAAAVVTDTGTVVAHASLVAREYAIPAVVGTGDATCRLRDGEIVTVDGSAGFVELSARRPG